MTTNQQRAAEVIGQAYQQAMESDIPSAWRGSVARALAAADHAEGVGRADA